MKIDLDDARAERRRSVLEAGQAEGLFDGANAALGARVPAKLLAEAKARSGIASTTDLIEYALAKVAIEDDFGAKLAARWGSISRDVKLDV